MKGSCKIRGGGSQERETFTLYILIAVILGLAVLSGLMWAGNIQFASDDQKNLVAGLLTTSMIVLIFIVLFLLTVRGNNCGDY